ncbi:MAG: DNA-binding winged helix-turn-helix (wHTH) protein, partial [Lentisphaeria bacterium]
MKNNNQNFSVSDVVVSPSHNEIESKGKVIRLQPQVMAVFYYLALHRERVIGNEELIENVWRGRVVTHSSVQKSINYLRKALVELIGENQLIAHYSKQGYQLQGVPVFFDAETKSDGDSGWLKFLPWPVNSYLVLALSIIFTASLGF